MLPAAYSGCLRRPDLGRWTVAACSGTIPDGARAPRPSAAVPPRQHADGRGGRARTRARRPTATTSGSSSATTATSTSTDSTTWPSTTPATVPASGSAAPNACVTTCRVGSVGGGGSPATSTSRPSRPPPRGDPTCCCSTTGLWAAATVPAWRAALPDARIVVYMHSPLARSYGRARADPVPGRRRRRGPRVRVPAVPVRRTGARRLAGSAVVVANGVDRSVFHPADAARGARVGTTVPSSSSSSARWRPTRARTSCSRPWPRPGDLTSRPLRATLVGSSAYDAGDELTDYEQSLRRTGRRVGARRRLRPLRRQRGAGRPLPAAVGAVRPVGVRRALRHGGRRGHGLRHRAGGVAPGRTARGRGRRRPLRRPRGHRGVRRACWRISPTTPYRVASHGRPPGLRARPPGSRWERSARRIADGRRGRLTRPISRRA